MLAMKRVKTIPFLGLMGMVVTACAAAQQPASTARPAYDGSDSPNAVQQIYIDEDCRIMPDPAHASTGKKARGIRDDNICHIESVHSSEHMEERIVGNELYRNRVRVNEQTYVLQNVAAKQVVFLVEVGVPKDWVVDSDPQPASLTAAGANASTAQFPVYADPGAIVQLHVGMRRPTPLKTKTIKTNPLTASGTNSQ
jgi:hypothetical protein